MGDSFKIARALAEVVNGKKAPLPAVFGQKPPQNLIVAHQVFFRNLTTTLRGSIPNFFSTRSSRREKECFAPCRHITQAFQLMNSLDLSQSVCLHGKRAYVHIKLEFDAVRYFFAFKKWTQAARLSVQQFSCQNLVSKNSWSSAEIIGWK